MRFRYLTFLCLLFLTLINLILITSCGKDLQINENEIIRFGVITDIQGNNSNLEFFMNQFINNKNQSENVDAVLVLGDLNDMADFVAGSDFDEMKSVLRKILDNSDYYDNKTNSTKKVPVYVIPGNHEAKAGYVKAIKAMKIVFKHENLHDLSDWNIVKFDVKKENKSFSVNLIPIPGYHLKKFTNPNGYLYDNNDLSELEKKINNSELNLIVAHGSPKGKSKKSIDALVDGKNVGNQKINDLILGNTD